MVAVIPYNMVNRADQKAIETKFPAQAKGVDAFRLDSELNKPVAGLFVEGIQG